jgi:hypothetical protein
MRPWGTRRRRPPDTRVIRWGNVLGAVLNSALVFALIGVHPYLGSTWPASDLHGSLRYRRVSGLNTDDVLRTFRQRLVGIQQALQQLRL